MKTVEDVLAAFKNFGVEATKKTKEKLVDFVKPFKEEVAELLTEIVEDEVFPYFKNYLLRKYEEEDFHRKVDEDFDLIQDLYDNHYAEYMKQLSRARKVRRFINWNNERLCTAVVDALQKEGFTIREKDVDWLMRNIEALRREIYG